MIQDYQPELNFITEYQLSRKGMVQELTTELNVLRFGLSNILEIGQDYSDVIDRDIDGLLEDYMQLNEKLKVLDKDNDDELPPLDDSMRKDACNTMSEITNSMDYGMMETLLDDIKNYKLNEEDDALIKRIRKLLLELDWDGISEELKSIEL